MDKRLLEAIKRSKELCWQDTEKFLKEEEKQVEMETKTNEVMHTTNTGFWEELVPDELQLDPMLDLIPQYSILFNMLPGYHWTNLWKSVTLPIVWEADLFSWNSEWTTWAPTPATPANEWPETWEITITQGMFILKVAISKRELNYAPMALENIVRDRINKSAGRTIDALFMNADSTTSNNVNDDGWTPSWNYYLENNNWMRDMVLADTNTVDIGTLSEWDFISVLGKLDSGYQADLQNLLWILPANVYNKAMLLDAVLTVDKFWPAATIQKWVLAKIFWIDATVQRDWPALALATWLVHTSTWNSYWSFWLVYKPTFQFGFWQALEIEPYKVPWKGIVLYATMEFWMALAYDKAWLW